MCGGGDLKKYCRAGLAGYINIDPEITPISNSFNGPTANRIFTLFTGEETNEFGNTTYNADIIGSIRGVDTGNADGSSSGPWALIKEQYYHGG